jgi:hypothetical protein
MCPSQRRFSKQADLYAKYRPDYPEEMYSFIFEHLDQQNVAWDCATGSGQVAGYLADHFSQVYANDISKEQLKHAPDKSNITYLNTPAEQPEVPDNAFDLITIAQAIHWLDFDQFYDVVREKAHDKSILAIIGYGMIRINDKLNPIIDDLYEEAFSQYFNNNRKYLDQEYQTIPLPFEEIPTPAFEISYKWDINHIEGYFNSWSAIQKVKSEQGYNPVDSTVTKIKSEVSNSETLKVRFPIFLRLAKI